MPPGPGTPPLVPLVPLLPLAPLVPLVPLAPLVPLVPLVPLLAPSPELLPQATTVANAIPSPSTVHPTEVRIASTSAGKRIPPGRDPRTQRSVRAADGGRMGASTPSIETRSEHTLDCHTDAILLREGAAGAVGSAQGGGASSAASGLPSATSLSVSSATPTTGSERGPFVFRRSAFPAAGMAFVVSSGPATKRAAARSPATSRLEPRPGFVSAPPPRLGSAPPASARPGFVFAREAGALRAFALGAVAAVSAGYFRGRGLEMAALACILAGMATLYTALARARHWTVRGKRHAARRRH
jgi:hypothetical protein